MRMRKPQKSQSCLGLAIDIILVFATGGLWLIAIAIRYMRNNS